ESDARDGRQGGSAPCEMEKISAGKFHFEPPSRFTSLDHLVGEGEQPIRHVDAKRFSGPEIDHEFKFRGLLDRQAGRPPAFENAASVNAAQAVRIGYARSVAHQPTRRGELP